MGEKEAKLSSRLGNLYQENFCCSDNYTLVNLFICVVAVFQVTSSCGTGGENLRGEEMKGNGRKGKSSFDISVNMVRKQAE